MTSRKIAPQWYIAFTLLLALGVGLRFYNLDKKVFWADETRSALRVSGYTTAETKAEMAQPRLWSPNELLKFQRMNEGHGVGDSLRSLATDDPKHPPLFYVLLRIWTGIFGDSVFAMRLLPAVLSLLTLPAMWWLCRELFDEEGNSPVTALVAVTLLALSPFHVIYAQEAREYSLWTAALLASSALLLRALRLGGRKWWLAYALSIALGLYTHTLMLSMWLAHAGYILIVHRNRWRHFALASAVAALVFAPWAVIIWQRRGELASNTIWLAFGNGYFFLFKAWLFNTGTLYFDAGSSRFPIVSEGLGGLVVRAMRILVLVVIFLAINALRRKSPRRTTAFIGCMIAIPFFAHALPDLAVGGLNSAIARFMIPMMLGVQLAVAFLIAQRLNEPTTQKRWSVVFGLLLVGSLASCLFNSQAEAWWNKASSFYVPRVARTINASENPLVLTEYNINLLALAHLLNPGVRLSVNGSYQPNQTAGSIYLYAPSEERLKKLRRGGYVFEKADAELPLWRLTNRGGAENEPTARIEILKSDAAFS